MTHDVVRAALFLDFDAVFGAMHGEDRAAADQFGKRPADWLRYFAEGRHDAVGGRPRSMLLVNCYLNPDGVVSEWVGIGRFGGYREFFVKAGFTVIDCPKLTRHGKNAADIRMVLDIVDALAHPTRFDEFIILSADADMTPVVQRLRAHDRRTTVLATETMAPALRASSDVLVEAASLIGALTSPPRVVEPVAPRSEPETATSVPPLDDAALRAKVLEQVREELKQAASGRLLSQLGINVRRQIPELRHNTKWPGGVALQDLLRNSGDPFIRFGQRAGAGLVYDPRVWQPPPDPAEAEAAATPASPEAAAYIRDFLAREDQPMALREVERLVRARFPSGLWPGNADGWAAVLRDAALAVLPVADGFVFDPRVHDPYCIRLAPGLGLETLSPPCRAMIERTARATACPTLPPESYRALFRAVAARDGEAVATDPAAVASVLESCRQAGVTIAASDVGYVLESIKDTAPPVSDLGAADGTVWAGAYAAMLERRCGERGPRLTDAERTLLRLWVGAVPEQEAILDTAMSATLAAP